MKLFTIDKSGKFVQFKEESFKSANKEIDLEDLLENNPEYFFDNAKILIIGRQVGTNLNTFIDLLGVDKFGDTVVIELKRDKTPRETLTQLIEYASFIENLDYDQLNEIYQNYSGEDVSLEEYHQQYFDTNGQQNISRNKLSKLVIVAQDISPEIKQTSLYLRKKGLDVYCLEFKYFVSKTGNTMISSNLIVGEEEYIRHKVNSAAQLPKTDKTKFFNSLDSNGKIVFEKLFDFVEKENLMFRWGSVGFSMNLTLNGGFVAICFGYPPHSVFKQSIYTCFEEITKKVNDSDIIVHKYKQELEKFKEIEPAKSNLKWIIGKKYSEDQIQSFLTILKEVIEFIKEKGLKS